MLYVSSFQTMIWYDRFRLSLTIFRILGTPKIFLVFFVVGSKKYFECQFNPFSDLLYLR